METEELDIVHVGGDLPDKWTMNSVTVDGISGERPNTLVSNLFFSIKNENVDAGKEMNWNPNWEVSEIHWMECGTIIPEHALCSKCGRRL